MAVDFNVRVSKLSVVRKGTGIITLNPNTWQQQYLDIVHEQLNDNGRIRLIVLKARQLGVSTITEAVAFSYCFMIPYYRAFICANKVSSAQRILEMTKLYWRTAPFRHLYKLHYNSKNDMSWNNHSSFKVATAGRGAEEDLARGDTIHFFHASEVAFWMNADDAMYSASQAVPNEPHTAIVLESTANGLGNYFERTWKEAVANPLVEFKPVFFSWLDHFEYRGSYIGMDPTRTLGALDDEETYLQRLGFDDDQLWWRRYMIANRLNGDPLKFAQEYPATPEQAFISTGVNVFDFTVLKANTFIEPGVRGALHRNGNKVTFSPHPMGDLIVYRKPDDEDLEWGQYLVAGDPTHRTQVGHDFACAQVINRHTLEQVAVWRGKVDPATFGRVLFNLGLYYNTAIVSSEAEGPASAAVGVLQGMNYPRLYHRARPDATPGKQTGDIWGWMTTLQSKQYMVAMTKQYLYDQSLKIHDTTTFSEMRDYVTYEDGKMGPADKDKGFDDTVMALCQALACHTLEGPVSAYNPNQEMLWDPPNPRIIPQEPPEWEEAG